MTLEDSLRAQIEEFHEEIQDLKKRLEEVTFERDEAQQKCKEISEHISGLGREDRENMNIVSKSISWGRGKIMLVKN